MSSSATVEVGNYNADDIKVLGRVYVPVGGGSFTVRMQSIGIKGTIAFYGRVMTPVIFDRELPDGRLFVNTAEVPRFHAVTRLRRMSDAEFLATKDIDFANEAVVTDKAATFADALVGLKIYTEDRQDVIVSSPAPAFLASAEKLTPELRVAIDGREVAPVQINMLFAGVPVPAGTHEVIFSRRIGRGWWWISAAALIAAIALSIIDVARRR